MPGPALLALALTLFLVLLLPVDRLRRAGWSPRALGAYLVAMLLLALLVAELPGPARFVVPILIVGYLAPFVTARVRFDGIRPGGGPTVTVERPPIKQVHGPVRDVPRPGSDAGDDVAEPVPGTAGEADRPAHGSAADDAGAGRTSRTG